MKQPNPHPIREFDEHGRLCAAGYFWVERQGNPFGIYLVLAGIVAMFGFFHVLVFRPTSTALIIMFCALVVFAVLCVLAYQHRDTPRAVIFHRDGTISVPDGLERRWALQSPALTGSNANISSIEQRDGTVVIISHDGDVAPVAVMTYHGDALKISVQLNKARKEILAAVALAGRKVS